MHPTMRDMERMASEGKRLVRDSYDSVPPSELDQSEQLKEEEEALESDEDQQLYQTSSSRRSTRRRSSMIMAPLVSQLPSHMVVDHRLVVPTNSVNSIDFFCCKFDQKEHCFFARDLLSGKFGLVFRIVKLPAKSLIGIGITSTWQIYLGENQPLAVIKQTGMKLNSTFFVFAGEDSNKGRLIYMLFKKLRSSKIRIYEGDNKTMDSLSHFCLYADDRVFVKLRDKKALGEALGETIVDWRAQNGTLRVGGGFDATLACACLVLAESMTSGGNMDTTPHELRKILIEARKNSSISTENLWKKIFQLSQ